MIQEDEEIYELVATDPLEKLKAKGGELEKEIDAIKEILKDTVTISKLNASAEELVSKLIDMVKLSQDMTRSVSKSNEDVSRQINKSIQEMRDSNRELSQKLDALLEFFAEAGEKEEIERSEIESDMQKVLSQVSSKIDNLVRSNQEISSKTKELEFKMEDLSKKKHVLRPAPLPSVMEQPAFPKPERPMPPPLSKGGIPAPKPFKLED
ncbi:MAG: hypothetical protein ABH829_04425 [archaeon]